MIHDSLKAGMLSSFTFVVIRFGLSFHIVSSTSEMGDVDIIAYGSKCCTIRHLRLRIA